MINIFFRRKFWLAGILAAALTGAEQAAAQTIPADTPAGYISALNAFIDHAVVSRNRAALDTLYAADFYFTHGSGHIDNKSSWLTAVMDTQGRYISREHDSVVVEKHDQIAMVYGKLTILRQQGQQESKYAIRYVRVFVFRDKHWQMISHRTVQQWNNLPIN